MCVDGRQGYAAALRPGRDSHWMSRHDGEEKRRVSGFQLPGNQVVRAARGRILATEVEERI